MLAEKAVLALRATCRLRRRLEAPRSGRECDGLVDKPLLRSILTFATIGYAANESIEKGAIAQIPTAFLEPVAMAQIATNILLLAIYLSQLMGRIGPKEDDNDRAARGDGGLFKKTEVNRQA